MVKSAVSLAVQVMLIVMFFVALMILVARVAGAAEPQNSCPRGWYWSAGDSACVPAAGVQGSAACAPGMYWSSRAGVCVPTAPGSTPPPATATQLPKIDQDTPPPFGGGALGQIKRACWEQSRRPARYTAYSQCSQSAQDASLETFLRQWGVTNPAAVVTTFRERRLATYREVDAGKLGVPQAVQKLEADFAALQIEVQRRASQQQSQRDALMGLR
jgi:hypothetical protein